MIEPTIGGGEHTMSEGVREDDDDQFNSQMTAPPNSQDIALDMEELESMDLADEIACLEPYYRDWGLPLLVIREKGLRLGRCSKYVSSLDYAFNELAHAKSGIKSHLFNHLSKHHCTIEVIDDECYLLDQSTNGSYVDGVLVGKDNRKKLVNGDILALGHPKYKAFYFKTRKDDYPYELRKNYRITTSEIGRGAMGTVVLAFDKHSDGHRKVAVKIIKLHQSTNNNDNYMKTILREASIMRRIQHPSCVGIEEVFTMPTKVVIVMEYMSGGELYSRIVADHRNGRGLGEPLTKFYTYQILDAIQYLHSKMITHRDLKPENILLYGTDDYTLLKISDFGLSKFIGEGSIMVSFVGTQNYLAPEIVNKTTSSSYTNKVDLWSLGVIVFTCLVGYPPFSKDYTDLKIEEQISKARLVFTRAWKHITRKAQSFVKQLLNISPNDRLSANVALAHEWFTNDTIVNDARNMMLNHSQSLQQPSSPRKRQFDSMDYDDMEEAGRCQSKRNGTTIDLSDD